MITRVSWLEFPLLFGVGAMEVSSLIQTLGGELGVDNDHIEKLVKTLETSFASNPIGDATDLVLFFPTYETASTYGCSKGLASESTQLL